MFFPQIIFPQSSRPSVRARSHWEKPPPEKALTLFGEGDAFSVQCERAPRCPCLRADMQEGPGVDMPMSMR